MIRKAFDHIGIPTTAPQPGESWVPFSEVWVTNPRAHPQRIEYLRAKNKPDVSPDDVPLWKLWNWPHVAYRVEDLRLALEGERLIYGPFDPGGFGEVAFIYKDGIAIEYMQYYDTSHWFGQPNPPGWTEAAFWGDYWD